MVEDEVKLVRAIRHVLVQEGHVVDVAADGATAVRMGQESSYDAVILDNMLPIMDGFQVCRTLRESKNTVPILMLTALGEIYDRVRGLDTGADDYLTKPFSFDELLARLRALNRRSSRNVEETVLRAYDLELDLTRREARRNGQAVDLTSTEFRLLELLVRNTDRTLSRARIIERVWGYTFDGQESVVDTYIHYLRAKVDKGQNTKLIHTVRGVGYMLGQR